MTTAQQPGNDAPTDPAGGAAARPSGEPPFFAPGSQILWRYRRLTGEPGQPETVRPVTVVRDDADALVAWLAPQTPVLRAVLSDGRDIRDAPLHQRFLHARSSKHDVWHGTGILKIAPTGVPWSVWVFWDADWNHLFWYINLEDVHVRDDTGIRTQDHALDVVVRPDGTTEWKDEDELEAAVEAGRFTAAQAAEFENDARAAEKVVARWGSPFCDDWPDWRPDPSWPLPALPDELRALRP